MPFPTRNHQQAQMPWQLLVSIPNEVEKSNTLQPNNLTTPKWVLGPIKVLIPFIWRDMNNLERKANYISILLFLSISYSRCLIDKFVISTIVASRSTIKVHLRTPMWGVPSCSKSKELSPTNLFSKGMRDFGPRFMSINPLFLTKSFFGDFGRHQGNLHNICLSFVKWWLPKEIVDL